MAQSWLIKTHVDNAARECSIVPGNFTSPSTPNEYAIVRALNRTVSELLDRHDWLRCVDETAFSGDGSTVLHALPEHYRRLCRQDNAVYEYTPNKRPLSPLTAASDWNEASLWNPNGANRFYRISGDFIDDASALYMEFMPILPDGATVSVASVNDLWVMNESNARLTSYTGTGNLSVIPGILLELGIIWRFKMSKALPYADYKAEYESTLARLIAEDTPARKIDFTNHRTPGTHPMRVPVPDYIPSS